MLFDYTITISSTIIIHWCVENLINAMECKASVLRSIYSSGEIINKGALRGLITCSDQCLLDIYLGGVALTQLALLTFSWVSGFGIFSDQSILAVKVIYICHQWDPSVL